MTNQLLSTLLISSFLIVSSATYAEGNIQNTPPDSLEWVTTPEGVAFASLVGDRFTGPYMSMVKLPAGLVSPPHLKTSNMFGVMISGSMIHSVTGADPSDAVVLPEGSFYRIPKNLPHVSQCVSKTDCITFLYQDGKFDFLPLATEVVQ